MLSKKFFSNKDRQLITTENYEEFLSFKEKNKENKIIGTHSGKFHGDDIFASLLIKFHPLYEKSLVIRTRNEEILKKCDILIGVGDKFDPQNLLFDYNIKDFKEVLDEKDEDIKDIKLSAIGLIYKYFGHEIIVNILQKNDLYERNKQHIDEIYKKLYMSLFMTIDAIRNRIDQFDNKTKEQPIYKASGDFMSRISRLNPEWNSKEAIDVNERVRKAWDIAEEDLFFSINKYANSYFLAYDIVEKGINEALEKKSEIVILEHFCPWKQSLFEIEKKKEIEGKFKFVIIGVEDKKWTSNAINVGNDGFECRKYLPEKWRGLEGGKLQEVTGMKEGIFVHRNGFIGFWSTKEAAIKAAEIALSS